MAPLHAHTNKEEAEKCLAIARKALAQHDLAKAEKWARKSVEMCPCDEGERLLLSIRMRREETPDGQPESRYQQGTQGPSSQHQGNGHHHQQNGHNAAGSSEHHGREHHGRERPAGMGTSNLHQRQAAGRQSKQDHTEKPLGPDPGTPEQKKLVAEILAAKDLYETLGLSKSATDDDVRKAYRKLALKLHPDKNRAHKADEAFKAVGRAFACLSDPDKRAYYDRTGYESSAAAAAAAQASRPGGGGGGMYYTQEIDPDEIFNMFFGGLAGMSPGARVFRAQFGGHPFYQHQQQQRRQQQQQQAGPQDESQRMFMGLLQFLPVLLLVLFSMFAASQKSPFSLTRDHNHYPDKLSTVRLEVPFYVKSKLEFDRSYPERSSSRFKLERQIESDYYDRQTQRCQSEKLAKHRAWTYGNREEASRMVMAACDEVDRINSKLGLRSNYYGGWAR